MSLAATTLSDTSLAGAQINALDPRALADVQRLARSNDPKALKAAAQQFEALFMQMVLKSMRDAMPHEGLFDSEQSRMYESLLDQQLAQVMSNKRGVGLAETIQRQWLRDAAAAGDFPDGLPLDPAAPALPLGRRSSLRTLPPAEGAVPPKVSLPEGAVSATEAVADAAQTPQAVRDFVARVLPDALDAARATGVPAPFLIAHAALETGWGRHEPRAADGTPSRNLFGIKAGNSWNGPSVQATTVEVVAGVAQQRSEKFRAYASYGDSFRDYARLLNDNPRYAAVRGTQAAASFANGLQQAGYATDPHYAAKLGRVIDALPRDLLAQAS